MERKGPPAKESANLTNVNTGLHSAHSKNNPEKLQAVVSHPNIKECEYEFLRLDLNMAASRRL